MCERILLLVYPEVGGASPSSVPLCAVTRCSTQVCVRQRSSLRLWTEKMHLPERPLRPFHH